MRLTVNSGGEVEEVINAEGDMPRDLCTAQDSESVPIVYSFTPCLSWASSLVQAAHHFNCFVCSKHIMYSSDPRSVSVSLAVAIESTYQARSGEKPIFVHWILWLDLRGRVPGKAFAPVTSSSHASDSSAGSSRPSESAIWVGVLEFDLARPESPALLAQDPPSQSTPKGLSSLPTE